MSNNKSADKNPYEIIIRGARLSFPQLWETKKVGNDGKPRYTSSFLLDPGVPEERAQIVALKALAKKVASDALKKDVEFKGDRSCVRKGDDKDYDGYAGMWYVTAARAESQGPPMVIDQKKQKLAKGPIPYAGCRVNAKVRFYFQDYDGVKRVNASLEVVQFVRNDEPFGNAGVSVDDMPEEETEESDGLDDSGIDDDSDLD